MQRKNLFNKFLALTSLGALGLMGLVNPVQARVWFNYSTVEQNVMLQSWQLDLTLAQHANQELTIAEFFDLVRAVPYLNKATLSKDGDKFKIDLNFSEIVGYTDKYCKTETENAVDHACGNITGAQILRLLINNSDFAVAYAFPQIKQDATTKKDSKTLNLLKGIEVTEYKDLKVSQDVLDKAEFTQYLAERYKIKLVPNR
ncbi:hypothetical protein CKF54_07385 [Psittacicella hinzii]|uniref:Uncharacterized protein n=1 Tax=Psittacicella hinzii TaxID=2028575 RepID=A0A3A1Y148_9GAMM|nr:hypothetical protein [Psittacicella hinzii]RIY31160.1 hypothetical protein CKF54_07385 [Psittacicella hinzii]